MTLDAVLEWIQANHVPAFFAGWFILLALGIVLNFFHQIAKQAVYAIRGVPAQITVSCPCSCHTKKEDEDSEDDVIEEE
jgi:hypothetical protein